MHATICCKPTAEGEWKPYSDRCCAPTDIPDAGSPLRVGPITPLLAQERGSWCSDRTIFRSNSEDGLVVACTASGTMPSELRRACYRPRGLTTRLPPPAAGDGRARRDMVATRRRGVRLLLRRDGVWPKLRPDDQAGEEKSSTGKKATDRHASWSGVNGRRSDSQGVAPSLRELACSWQLPAQGYAAPTLTVTFTIGRPISQWIRYARTILCACSARRGFAGQDSAEQRWTTGVLDNGWHRWDDEQSRQQQQRQHDEGIMNGTAAAPA